ncbi:MAG: putative glycoside hydrolase [Candidatus Hydrogenedentes bacterium]|nr:putative glycoside hydrolase [Candidatus Hydrogenedentota bacterium]
MNRTVRALSVILFFPVVSAIAVPVSDMALDARSLYVLPDSSIVQDEFLPDMLEPLPVADAAPDESATPAIPANPFPCLPERASPVEVRALYLTGWTVGINSQLQHYAELADKTELTAYVVDIKDMDGHIGYKSEIPRVVEIGAFEKRYDPRKVVDTFHEHNVRVIARIACFKDPVASSKLPELAVRTKSGALWKDVKKATWLNPYSEKAWAYLVDIAKEALALGFDEIQFDYVRFPSDGNVRDIDYGKEPRPKYEAINGFLAYARKEMPDAIISADVFGVMCVSAGDTEGLGQFLELVVQNVDYLSPMIYPSHYRLGQVIHKKKYPTPDTEPYAVVSGTLATAQERIATVQSCETARIRPYLQDFTAKWLGAGHYKSYEAADIRAQIKAAKDTGYPEWILWNARNRYTESALAPKKPKTVALGADLEVRLGEKKRP